MPIALQPALHACDLETTPSRVTCLSVVLVHVLAEELVLPRVKHNVPELLWHLHTVVTLGEAVLTTGREGARGSVALN